MLECNVQLNYSLKFDMGDPVYINTLTMKTPL